MRSLSGEAGSIRWQVLSMHKTCNGRTEKVPTGCALDMRFIWNSWRDIEGRGENCEGRTARGDQRGKTCEGQTARGDLRGRQANSEGDKRTARATSEQRGREARSVQACSEVYPRVFPYCNSCVLARFYYLPACCSILELQTE